MRNVVALMVFLALVALTAWVGVQFVPGEWYAALRKPPLNPPNWVFTPVWSLLYLSMAVAAWLVWRACQKPSLALALWGVQLIFNGAWSWLFFGLQRPGLALLDTTILLIVVAATTFGFYRLRPLAAALMIPYLVWVGFAAYVNAGIWYLNR